MIQRLQDIYYDTEKRTLMRRTQAGTEIILFPEGQQPAIEAVADPTVLTVPKPKLGDPELAAAFIRIKAKILGVDITDSCEIQASGTGITGHFGVGTEHNLFTLTALASEDTILAVNVSHPTYGSISLNVPVKCYLWPVTDLVTEYIETRHKRSTTQPETPVGDNPAGWTVAPPDGTIALWSSIAQRKGDGTLLTAWSTPERVTGVDGAAGAAGAPGKTYYFAYHDNPYTSTPATPTGEGVTDGWHSALTSSSVWVSVKFAVNRSDADAWSTPVVQSSIEAISGYAPKYLGAFTSAPDGSVNKGDYYYNTATRLINTYSGSAWVTTGVTEEMKRVALPDILGADPESAIAVSYVKNFLAHSILAGSITSQMLSTDALTALIGNFSKYIQISDRGFVGQTKPTHELVVDDRRIYLDKDELAIQKVSSLGASFTNVMPVQALTFAKRWAPGNTAHSIVCGDDGYFYTVTVNVYAAARILRKFSQVTKGDTLVEVGSIDLTSLTSTSGDLDLTYTNGKLYVFYKNTYNNLMVTIVDPVLMVVEVTKNLTNGAYVDGRINVLNTRSFCWLDATRASKYFYWITYSDDWLSGNGGGYPLAGSVPTSSGYQMDVVDGYSLVMGSRALFIGSRAGIITNKTIYVAPVEQETSLLDMNIRAIPLGNDDYIFIRFYNGTAAGVGVHYKFVGSSYLSNYEAAFKAIPFATVSCHSASNFVNVEGSYYFVYIDLTNYAITLAKLVFSRESQTIGVVNIAKSPNNIFTYAFPNCTLVYKEGSFYVSLNGDINNLATIPYKFIEYSSHITWSDELVLGRNGAGLTYKNTVISDGDITLSGSSVKNVMDNSTAINTLAKLLTVDGSGCGLDADLLDGLHASSFSTAKITVSTSQPSGGNDGDLWVVV